VARANRWETVRISNGRHDPLGGNQPITGRIARGGPAVRHNVDIMTSS
jgi:hypothetical protein